MTQTPSDTNASRLKAAQAVFAEVDAAQAAMAATPEQMERLRKAERTLDDLGLVEYPRTTPPACP